jgi:hypothetical protein
MRIFAPVTKVKTNRFSLAAQITRGLFLTDSCRSPLGRMWQLVSRFTWELPQTFVGWLYSLCRALVGQADRVDHFGGITFVTKSGCKYGMGVSLGSFIDLWVDPWTCGEGEKFVLGNQLCMHEVGHTADSQRFGWAYLPVIGLSSLLSALGKGNHNVFWTELRANTHAKRYFGKYYGIAWNDNGFPTENLA